MLRTSKRTLFALTLLLCGCHGNDQQTVASAADAAAETAADSAPQPIKVLPAKLVIGHRGAPAYLPEHTIAGYTKAIELGADAIEPDLVSTKDGELVARHENEISKTTNVADHPEFAARNTTKTIDGSPVTGWFTEDFTLAELKTLRAKERIPDVRPGNTKFDGQYEIPTLKEIIDLAHAKSIETGRTIAIYPEIKHSTYFVGIGLPIEDKLLRALDANGYKGADAPVFIQSFEVANLKALHAKTAFRLVQLTNLPGMQPYDFVVAKDARTYADLLTPTGLAEVATYAAAIGVDREQVIPRNPADDTLGAPSSLIADAHAAKLLVHPYTFRPENRYLPKNYWNGTDPAAIGNSAGDITAFLKAGVDGVFTDAADVGRSAFDAFAK